MLKPCGTLCGRVALCNQISMGPNELDIRRVRVVVELTPLLSLLELNPFYFSLCWRYRRSSHYIMPKIRTTRTKAPPEGYEDIEEVGLLVAVAFCSDQCCRSWKTTRRRCEMLRMNLTKESARQSHCGLLCESRMRVHDISMNCTTKERQFRENFMTGF